MRPFGTRLPRRGAPALPPGLLRSGLLLAALAAVPTPALADDPDPDSAEEAAEQGQALVLELRGPIGPASSDFVVRGIERAEASGAALVIIRMDTPGGLDTAMRDIIRKIIASEVPVVSFVAPGGSRAASAGTYIMYASHVAAMAPATNLGAATPVRMSPGAMPGGGDRAPGREDEQGAAEQGAAEQGAHEQGAHEQGAHEQGAHDGGTHGEGAGDAQDEPETGDSGSGNDGGEPATPEPGSAMERKIVNDAVAYIRGLARMRGRNAEWAERAVREGVSLTAEDALEQGVVDLVAADTRALLRALDGREVEVLGQTRTLDTDGIGLVVVEPDWRSELLSIIANPNVAYILMLLGIYGLFFELSNPGSIVPGVIGAVSLLLALYAFQVLPVNYAGLALILLGIAFMLGEVFVPSFGALGIGGAISFVIGSLVLMDTDAPGYQLSVPLIIGFAAASAAFFIIVMGMAVRQRRQPVVSGEEQMVGSIGEALEACEREGRVWIHGEAWQARAAAPLTAGQRVRVRAMDGLTLVVEPVDPEQ